jgi:protocatechuate 3,4-dioxygenase beta subunit
VTGRRLLLPLVALAAAASLLALRACSEGGDDPAPSRSPRKGTAALAPRERAAARSRAEETAPEPGAPAPVTVHITLPEGVRGASVAMWPMAATLQAGDDEVDSFRPSDEGLGPAGASAAVGATGTISLAPPRAGAWLLVLHAPGFARTSRVVVVPDGGSRPELDLAPVEGVALRGVVFGPDGGPAAGVRVVAAPTAMTETLGHDALCVRTRTSADGTFELRDLLPGDHALWAAAQGGTLQRLQTVRVPAVSDVELRLVRGARITGVVLDDATGAAVPGARVSLAQEEDWPRRGTIVHAQATCDATGRFELWSGSPDCAGAMLVVDATDFARLPTEDVLDAARDLGDGVHVDVALRVVRAATVLGTVRGPDGPVAGCVVVLQPKDAPYDDGWQGLWRAVTGRDGLYRIDGLPPGAFELTAGVAWPDDPRGDAGLTGEAAPGAVVPLDVRLVRGAPVRGRVVDPHGAPIAGAMVTWSCGATPGTTWTGADGRFQLALPEEGEVETWLFFRHPAWQCLDGGVDHDAYVQREGDLGDVELEPPVHFRGRVLEADGTAVAGARVLLVAGEPAQEAYLVTLDAVRTTVTDRDGKWELVAMDDDVVIYAFHPRDGRPVFRGDAPDAGADDFDLVFPAGVRLAGRVVDAADGRPLAGVLVSPPWDDAPAVARTDADGRFTYPTDAQTPPLVTFARDGYRTAGVSLMDLLDAEPANVEVRLTRVHKLRGSVHDAQGVPLVGKQVTLTTPDGTREETARTDASAQFVFRDLAAGLVHLQVEGDPWTATVESDIGTEVKLVFDRK